MANYITAYSEMTTYGTKPDSVTQAIMTAIIAGLGFKHWAWIGPDTSKPYIKLSDTAEAFENGERTGTYKLQLCTWETNGEAGKRKHVVVALGARGPVWEERVQWQHQFAAPVYSYLTRPDGQPVELNTLLKRFRTAIKKWRAEAPRIDEAFASYKADVVRKRAYFDRLVPVLGGKWQNASNRLERTSVSKAVGIDNVNRTEIGIELDGKRLQARVDLALKHGAEYGEFSVEVQRQTSVEVTIKLEVPVDVNDPDIFKRVAEAILKREG